ncbi:matrixin family metalloprotease [Streptomyces sp. ID05-39B]|uniref:matrixin family metalloprotease n=1 Tax=Streptomyces sp. ID05-39B TaxID=3028664 RepID=UPI0029BB7A43|nr:matrixin family metalloprotease [Streptomyces sp. ID05-39B]MDX3527366.1 matrixin family metalloprotease [Streptomyces sp. ID05-39B]
MGKAVVAAATVVSLAALGGGAAPARAGGGGCVLAPGALTVDDLPAGSSVLDCAAVGRLVTHAGAGVTVPDPGMKVSVDALTEDGSLHGFTLAVATDGTVSYDDLTRTDTDTGTGTKTGTDTETVTGTGFTSAHDHARASVVGAPGRARAACADDAYATAGHKEYDTYEWFLGDGTLPGNLAPDDARRAFEAAIGTITASRNDCGFGDTVTAKARFLSRTGNEADIDRDARCMARDGVSVWDAGDLRGGVVATTCSWSRTVSGGPDALREADVRFNTGDHTFTDHLGEACSNTYDLRSVATHEAGHVFGLAHVGESHESQTMYTNSFVCSAAARTLGRGDVLGLRALY